MSKLSERLQIVRAIVELAQIAILAIIAVWARSSQNDST